MLAHVGKDPAQTASIAKLLRQNFGVAEMTEGGLVVAERPERVSERQPNVDGLLHCRGRVRKMAERHERLLQAGCRLAVVRPGKSLGPGLAQGRYRIVPDATAERVVGELFDVLGQTLVVQRRERVGDVTMKRAAALVEEAAVRHVVGQGVPEGVLDVWKELRLVEELAGLEMHEASTY